MNQADKKDREFNYLNFIELEPKAKTKVFEVANKGHDTLGIVKWHAPWRRYVFIASDDGVIFDASCLADLQYFICRLMLERKEKK